jgi:hypothetical protein
MAFNVTQNSFHVFLTSDGCLKRYPENRPNDFWISLRNEKVLTHSQRWQVGIQNIHFDSDLYNLGVGTGAAFMFLYRNVYHVVEPPSAFVSNPVEAVDILNASLRKYCLLNQHFFDDEALMTEEELKRSGNPSEVDLAFRNLMAPSSSAGWTSRLRPVNDKNFNEDVELLNDFTAGLKRHVEEEAEKRRVQLKNFERRVSVDDGVVETGVKNNVSVRTRRAISEEPSKQNPKIPPKPFDPETLLKFFVDDKTGKVFVKLGFVKDFGLSRVLQLMLGFHSKKKVFQEMFEFRKRCRLFLSTLSKHFDLVSAIEKEEIMLHPFRVRKSLPMDRDRFYISRFQGFGYDRFVDSYGSLLENELKSLIAGQEDQYHLFVEKSYVQSRRGPTESAVKKRTIPFSVYSIIDFIFYVVAYAGLDGSRSKVTMKSDGVFKPHVFDRLYVYSNIVKPVDYDDKNIRLMDIVYLQPKSGGNYGVVDYRSVVFQEVDVDVLNDIHILISTSLGTPAPFMHGPMCLTLQFRRDV